MAIVFQERWEVVYEELRGRILRGEIHAGTQLPETELSEELGVSRGPVREALRALTVAGLVHRGGRRPAVVASTTNRDVEELFSVREAMEAFAVERAMKRHARELEVALSSQVAAMAQALHTSQSHDFLEDDVAFHDTFYQFADNDRLSGIWGNLQDPVRMMMRLSLHLSEPHWGEVLSEHQMIVEAVTSGDAERAARAVREHLQLAFRRANSYVSTLASARPDQPSAPR